MDLVYMSLNTTPVDVAESDCAAIWELEEGAVACGSQKSRRGWCNRSVKSSITRSTSCKQVYILAQSPPVPQHLD